MEKFDEINRLVRELLSETLKTATPPDELDDQIYMGTASGFDSSKLLEFILSMEEKFNFFVPDEDLSIENFDSIGKITNYILMRTQPTPVS